MVSKKIRKSKSLVASIVCVVMLFMVFLTSCQSAEDIAGQSVNETDSGSILTREAGVQPTARAAATDIDSRRNVELPKVTLSGNGEVVEVTAETDFIFTPVASGMWYIYTSDNGDSDPYLCFGLASDDYSIQNDDDSGEGLNAYIAIVLDAGVEYSLHAHFKSDVPGRYILAVTQQNPQISGNVEPFVGGTLNFGVGKPIGGSGEITISGRTELEFTSDSTMGWSFWTSNNGDCDPYFELYDSAGNRICFKDDMSTTNLNAYMPIFLERGESYVLRVGFWDSEGQPTDEGECTLSVMESKNIIFDGSNLFISGGNLLSVLVPDVSGLWEFRTSTENDESDPIIRIFDRYGEMLIDDDNSAGDLDALIRIELTAGEPYLVRVVFRNSDLRETTLETAYIGQ